MPLDCVTSRLHTRCVKHRRLGGEVETDRPKKGDRNKERVPGSESARSRLSPREIKPVTSEFRRSEMPRHSIKFKRLCENKTNILYPELIFTAC